MCPLDAQRVRTPPAGRRGRARCAIGREQGGGRERLTMGMTGVDMMKMRGWSVGGEGERESAREEGKGFEEGGSPRAVWPALAPLPPAQCCGTMTAHGPLIERHNSALIQQKQQHGSCSSCPQLCFIPLPGWWEGGAFSRAAPAGLRGSSRSLLAAPRRSASGRIELPARTLVLARFLTDSACALRKLLIYCQWRFIRVATRGVGCPDGTVAARPP